MCLFQIKLSFHTHQFNDFIGSNMNSIKKSMQEIFSYQFCIVLLSMGSDLGWAAGSNKLGNCSKICAKTAELIQKRSHTYFEVWVLRISLVSVTVEKFLSSLELDILWRGKLASNSKMLRDLKTKACLRL
jgi:hypothetical protein